MAKTNGKSTTAKLAKAPTGIQGLDEITHPPPATGEAIARKILIVDDNEDVSESLSGWLSDLGHDVRVADDGESALREARAFRPELMLVDIELPDMNGREAAQKLRDIPELKDVVLIALTGYSREEDRRLSREAGFDRHYIKPLTSEMLSELLTSLD